ncbi:MAG TPA: hypothetical protein VFW11_09545 [Cyclobacteriaceae bacterium]|nr:hypothetical protein [Cyclobacteriaceae bacterium]
MNQQPDKLFKSKLENYHRPAPVNAWARIESGLSKKNNRGFWLKIAASLTLIAIVSYGIIAITKKDNTTPLLTEQKSPEQLLPAEDKGEINDVPEKTERVKEKVLQPILKKNRAVEKQSEKTTNKIPEETPYQQIKMTVENEVTVNEEVASTNEPAITSDRAVKGFKLVIEADEVNEKYLMKSTIAKATSEDNSASGIKKLLDKANDLKNNQDPVGDLRHMKNEILALNFQSNKKHGQNK